MCSAASWVATWRDWASVVCATMRVWKRVIASSPDGEIVGAVDIPVETAAPIESHPWAAGVSFNPITQTGGIWLERDIGRVRLGVDLNHARPNLAAPLAAEIRVRAGWKF